MPKCFALFSGGLDSALAIKHMQKLGVEVIALNFVSHFFGGPSDKLNHMAEQLGVKVVFVPFHEQQLAVTTTPKAGRGKNFNACIDCHSTMINIAGQLMEKYGVQFIVTGEVLGQRPMSQNAQALVQVSKLSEYGKYIVRPLSGQLLQEPEIFASVGLQKSQLLSISGRSSLPQEKLAKEYGIVQYPSHGGGCMLTEPVFGDKMKKLFQDQCIGETNQFIYKCMRNGRLLRYAEAQYLIVGRNEADNKFLEQFQQYCEYCQAVTPQTEPIQLFGPNILILDFSNIKGKLIEFKPIEIHNDIEEMDDGVRCSFCKHLTAFQQQPVKFEANQELREFAKIAFSLYSKGKGNQDCVCDLNGEHVKVAALSTDIQKMIREKLVE